MKGVRVEVGGEVEKECWLTLFKLRYKELLNISVVLDPSRSGKTTITFSLQPDLLNVKF